MIYFKTQNEKHEILELQKWGRNAIQSISGELMHRRLSGASSEVQSLMSPQEGLDISVANSGTLATCD